MLGDWIKQHLWSILVVLGVGLVGFARLQGQQESTLLLVERLEKRMSDAEKWQVSERSRLDAAYVSREVAVTQYAEILGRLSRIEEEQREQRRLLQGR